MGIIWRAGVTFKKKDFELIENIDNVKMPQEPRCDEIQDGLLDDNVKAIFQDQIVMPNNDKSILTSNSHTLQKEIQCQFCDYKPANAGNIKHHVENEHQGLK